MDWLKRRWFLVGLVVLILLGLLLGMRLPAETVQAVERHAGRGMTSSLVAIIMFLMSYSLDSQLLGRSIRRPGPVIFGCLVNGALVPLLAWPLLPLQRLDDFALGLMIAAAVPCTLAAASVWTRRAHGNDAVALLVTMVTNSLCFIVTPLWLSFVVESTFELDAGALMRQLIFSALIPAALGQLARLIAPLRNFAAAYRAPISVIAQSCVLATVFAAALFKAGPQLGASGGIEASLPAVVIVWTSCIVVHLAAIFLAWHGGRWLGFARADRIAIAFSGSQKTLPIGLLVASHFGGFTLFPMLMYHASQLFIDTAVADRVALLPDLPTSE
ncbi:MAG: bile acid:sodium symporter [Planctomycetaceae bacterium]|nr:bile acid:sodium symporter [Planctomycetaceae bacterium]